MTARAVCPCGWTASGAPDGVRAAASRHACPTPIAPCGTRAAYLRHRRRGETPCEPCRAANRAANRSYQAGRAAPAAPKVSATGTRRRLQALAHEGHTAAAIAAAAGVACDTLKRIRAGRGAVVRRSTAEKVRAAYDQLAGTDGGSHIIRARAAGRGWPPPAAWDGRDIDDPAATPDPDAQPCAADLRTCPTCEDAIDLLGWGDPPEQVAARLGLTLAALEKHLYRHGQTLHARPCAVARSTLRRAAS